MLEDIPSNSVGSKSFPEFPDPLKPKATESITCTDVMIS
jgi:hypothetical protein